MGRVIKDRVSQDVMFEGQIVMGQIVPEANYQVPSCSGPNIAQHIHKAELSRVYLSEPSFPNNKYRKNISMKAVHAVILGVTIAFVRWCTD